MGEVYRARDTKLNRDVAIKILPDVFAADPDRLARFTREAQTLAALNHPHIAHVYGVEEGPALVMELVDGEDLAQRIARGRLPLDEAIAIARQVADALEAAHEQGIVHRDLKPANVKVKEDGTVKVLDFGLAKAMGPEAGRYADAMNSPTLTVHATGMGVVLGTAAYMAPEQAKGKAIDKRADIWAFGAVLFEMLTARRPFVGDSTTEILGAVVLNEPDWSTLPSTTPPRVRELLRRCLEKDPKRRLRDIGDARFELSHAEGQAAVVPAVRSGGRGLRTAGLVAAGALVATIVTWLATRATEPPPPSPIRFSVSGLGPLVFDAWQTLTLSPDGRALAFRGRGADGVDRVFIRELNTLQVRPLPGSEGARMPFFSADGQWLGFFAAGSLKKVPLSGGPPQTIAPASTPAGATWMDDGSIVFVGDVQVGVQRVPSSGGTPETVLAADRKSDVTTPASPWAIPGSDGVLLMIRRGNRFDLAVLSLRDRSVKVIAQDAYSPAWVPTGHVLFHQGDALLALPFDSRSLTATGPAFPVASGVGNRISYQSRLFAVAGDGTLVYVPAAPAGEGGWTLLWVDRNGQETVATRLERAADTPRLSPDGTRIAFRTPAPNCDVWVHDLTRGTTTRLTQEGDNHGIVWTTDGSRVVVARVAASGTDILAIPADGAGKADRLTAFGGESGALPSSWSSGAGVLLVQDRFSSETGMDILGVATGGGEPKALINAPSDESEAVLAPDARHIAYVSNETGRQEVYVRQYPEQGHRVQVSTAGGGEPVWSRDGKELFFRNGRELLAVPVATSPSFSPGRPQVLFTRDYPAGPLLANYDVSPDGKRFLMMRGRQWIEGQVVVVLNWFSEWKQLGSGAAIPDH